MCMRAGIEESPSVSSLNKAVILLYVLHSTAVNEGTHTYARIPHSCMHTPTRRRKKLSDCCAYTLEFLLCYAIRSIVPADMFFSACLVYVRADRLGYRSMRCIHCACFEAFDPLSYTRYPLRDGELVAPQTFGRAGSVPVQPPLASCLVCLLSFFLLLLCSLLVAWGMR